ncbi:MAG: non-canonical purine NTP pyrophosphatase [Candidatus Shapirobacteria bacterium]
MVKKLFYATNNPGKKFEISRHLLHHGIKVVTPDECGIDLDVEESGSSLEENATLKAKAYVDLVSDKLILADDTGLEIDALGGEPGIHVRRWKDGKSRLTDQELIDYCLEKMKGVPVEKRGAQFRTVLALDVPGKGIEIFEGILRGYILEEASVMRVEGFPFESLFFVPEWNMLLGDARQLPVEKKQHLLNHRERAIEKAIPRIRELLEEVV